MVTEKYINSVPLAPKAFGAGRGDRRAFERSGFGVWRSAFSVLGDLRLRLVV
jgi:hypothetical protein